MQRSDVIWNIEPYFGKDINIETKGYFEGSSLNGEEIQKSLHNMDGEENWGHLA